MTLTRIWMCALVFDGHYTHTGVPAGRARELRVINQATFNNKVTLAHVLFAKDREPRVLKV